MLVGLTTVERSVLIYLLDAIDCESDKTLDLLKIASKPEASSSYRGALDQLRAAHAAGLVLDKSQEIRISLR